MKNQKFREASQVKIDVVNYVPTEDRSTALIRFEAGELDSLDDIPTEQMSVIRTKFKDDFFNAPYLGTYYFSIKEQIKAPFNNPKYRRALSLMIVDREYLAEKIGWWGWHDEGWLLCCSPGIKGYKQAEPDYAKTSPLDREDEAKKIMA